MNKTGLEKIEEVYLQLFKLVLVIVLSSALITSGVYLFSSFQNQSAKEVSPEPAKTANKPKVVKDAFIDEFMPKAEHIPTKENPIKEVLPIKPEVDENDKLIDQYLQKIWAHVEIYQKQCLMPEPVDKETFMTTFPKDALKTLLVAYKVEFFESQDNFVKSVLESPSVVKICKDTKGKAGVLFKALDWHTQEWERQLDAGKKFEMDELERVSKFRLEEQNRVEIQKQQAKFNLMYALYSFGVFMSLALLLIFSKIESNLRGMKLKD